MRSILFATLLKQALFITEGPMTRYRELDYCRRTMPLAASCRLPWSLRAGMFRVGPQTIQRWRQLAARRMKCLLPVLCLAGSVAASCSAQGREAGTLSTNSGALAVVLGKTVGVDQKHVALSLIFNTMLDKFARDNKLSVDESEIDAYLQGQRRRDMITILVLEKRLKDLDRDVASPILSDEAKAKKGKERAQCDKLLTLA
jgi:hypothetical protein